VFNRPSIYDKWTCEARDGIELGEGESMSCPHNVVT
jgi:hypothetical protein